MSIVTLPTLNPWRITRAHEAHVAEFGSRIALLLKAVDPELRSSSMRALRADWRIFLSWSAASNVTAALPSKPQAIIGFVQSMRTDKSAATIIRYVRSIVRLHRLAGEANPSLSPLLQQTMRDMHRERTVFGARLRNAGNNRWLTFSGVPNRACIAAMVSTDSGHEVLDARNRALLLLANEGSYRPSQLVALNWQDVIEDGDGNDGVVDDMTKPIVFKMTLGEDTRAALLAWRMFNSEGRVFRRLYNIPSMDYSVDRGWLLGDLLSRQSISLIFRSMLDCARTANAFGRMTEIDWLTLRQAASGRNVCCKR